MTWRRTSSCIIRCIAWHPHQLQFGVALHNDTIALYHQRNQQSDGIAMNHLDQLSLSHQHMTNVTTMMVCSGYLHILYCPW
jgi:hypothetical protein